MRARRARVLRCRTQGAASRASFRRSRRRDGRTAESRLAAGPIRRWCIRSGRISWPAEPASISINLPISACASRAPDGARSERPCSAGHGVRFRAQCLYRPPSRQSRRHRDRHGDGCEELNTSRPPSPISNKFTRAGDTFGQIRCQCPRSRDPHPICPKVQHEQASHQEKQPVDPLQQAQSQAQGAAPPPAQPRHRALTALFGHSESMPPHRQPGQSLFAIGPVGFDRKAIERVVPLPAGEREGPAKRRVRGTRTALNLIAAELCFDA